MQAWLRSDSLSPGLQQNFEWGDLPILAESDRELQERCRHNFELQNRFQHYCQDGEEYACNLYQEMAHSYVEKLRREAAPGSLQASIAKYSSFWVKHGTDKDTMHSYGPLYERLLAPYRETATRVLEIGLYSGASLVVWAEYFKKATIDGVDIDASLWRFDLFPLKDPRIRMHELDGTLLSAPAELVKRGAPEAFDVIIEDGSHSAQHQVSHLEAFASSIAPGGIYIIEDIMQENVLKLHKPLAELCAKHSLRCEWHDLRRNKHRPDDIVAVFYKET
jgi:predicted O-methyltransferase YrrM